jgi:hypothetical protein
MRHWIHGLPLFIVVALLAAPARAEARITFGLSAAFGSSEGGARWTLASVPVGTDKLAHFMAGLAIAWVLSSAGWDPRLALAGTGAVGTLKEVRDAGMLPGLGHGDVEVADVAWTCAGGLAYLGLRQMLASPPASRSLHNY